MPGGYRLDVGRESVDAERFEALVRARRYEEGLALWHGAALEEWAEQPWGGLTQRDWRRCAFRPWRPAWPRRSTRVDHPRCSPSWRRSSKTTRYVSGCVSYWLRLSTPLAAKLTRSRRTRGLAVISLTRSGWNRDPSCVRWKPPYWRRTPPC